MRKGSLLCFQKMQASVQELHFRFFLQWKRNCIRDYCSNTECHLSPDTFFFFFFPSLQEVHMPKAENWWLNDRNSEHSIIGHSKAQARIKLHSPSVQGMLAGIARQNNLFHSELLMWSYQWLSAVFATLTVRSGSSCLFTYLKISKVPITTIEIQTSANIKLPTHIAGVGYSFW